MTQIYERGILFVRNSACVSLIAVTSVFAAALSSTSCHKKELDRETALKLVQGHQFGDPLQFQFGDLKHKGYDALEHDGLLSCSIIPGWGLSRCRSTSPDIRVEPSLVNGHCTGTEPECSLIALFGTYTATAISGISQTGTSSAEAEIIVSFTPTNS